VSPRTRARAGILILVAALAGGSGCGGASEEERVRDAVGDFGTASAKKDYQHICDDLVAKDLAESVEAVGLPCEVAFKRGLDPVKDPKIEIKKVKINKTRALVSIRSTAKNQPPSDDTLELVLEGGDWRIASLAKPQPQPTTSNTP
jgi:hypothetical protein